MQGTYGTQALLTFSPSGCLASAEANSTHDGVKTKYRLSERSGKSRVHCLLICAQHWHRIIAVIIAAFALPVPVRMGGPPYKTVPLQHRHVA
jgi:hypothetical protein